LNRYLTIRIHYPKPEHKDETIAAVQRVAQAARAHEGLVEIGAWLDEASDRIVNISLWESEDLAIKATQAMHPLFADIPWSDWERQPAENFLSLKRAV
jgi:hypothetical protein